MKHNRKVRKFGAKAVCSHFPGLARILRQGGGQTPPVVARRDDRLTPSKDPEQCSPGSAARLGLRPKFHCGRRRGLSRGSSSPASAAHRPTIRRSFPLRANLIGDRSTFTIRFRKTTSLRHFRTDRGTSWTSGPSRAARKKLSNCSESRRVVLPPCLPVLRVAPDRRSPQAPRWLHRLVLRHLESRHRVCPLPLAAQPARCTPARRRSSCGPSSLGSISLLVAPSSQFRCAVECVDGPHPLIPLPEGEGNEARTAHSLLPSPSGRGAGGEGHPHRTPGPGSGLIPLARGNPPPSRVVVACILAIALATIGARRLGADQRVDRSIEATGKDLITPETQQAIDRGLAFLAGRQDPRDGSFGANSSGRRRVAVTALAGLALLSSGSTPGRGKYGVNVQRAVDFLLTRCQPNGFIFDEGNTGHGPMYDHGFATLFLAEVYGMTKTANLRNSLERAVRLIINSQNKEGGWRYEPDSKDADLSVTVCEVMALRAARNSGISVPKETIDRCTEYVRKSQTPDGGFRYQLTTAWQVTFGLTAAGVVALYSSGVYGGKAIDSGLNYLERFRPSLTVRQLVSHYFYSHYYAVQAMWHAGGERWQQWYTEIRDELIQFPYHTSNGSWRDTSAYGDEYATAMALLILQTPNNYLPIFQR
jgi:Prenyltransferase and squalene oxidase repeat